MLRVLTGLAREDRTGEGSAASTVFGGGAGKLNISPSFTSFRWTQFRTPGLLHFSNALTLFHGRLDVDNYILNAWVLSDQSILYPVADFMTLKYRNLRIHTDVDFNK